MARRSLVSSHGFLVSELFFGSGLSPHDALSHALFLFLRLVLVAGGKALLVRRSLCVSGAWHPNRAQVAGVICLYWRKRTQCATKYSVPTPQLNKIKKRLLLERRLVAAAGSEGLRRRELAMVLSTASS